VLIDQTATQQGIYVVVSQSKQTSSSLFFQNCFPHTLQVVFRIKSFLSCAAFEYITFFAGKLIALLWQRGAQAEQRSVVQPPPALGRIGNDCFSVLKRGDAVWAEFYAAWFSSFSAAIALVRKNYRKPWAIRAIHQHSSLIFCEDLF